MLGLSWTGAMSIMGPVSQPCTKFSMCGVLVSYLHALAEWCGKGDLWNRVKTTESG